MRGDWHHRTYARDEKAWRSQTGQCLIFQNFTKTSHRQKNNRFQSKQKDTSKYVPEGVEGFAKYKGDVGSIIYKLIGGLKSSMGYLGSKDILKLRKKPNFVKITKAGFYESMVHNVDVIKNDSKY